MKKLSNMKGAKALNKNEQRSVNGGKAWNGQPCGGCPLGWSCINGVCRHCI
jgi:hypothetical protein